MKRLSESKTRLSPVLRPRERRTLALRMLEDVLNALALSSRVEIVVVVSPDPAALSLARSLNATPLEEEPPGGLNQALNQALRFCESRGAKSALIIPADVPLVTPEDVSAILARDGYSTVVISPSRREDGTNAMLLSPPTLISPAYGSDSFSIHAKAASSAGAALKVARLPRVALDVDTPEDLKELIKLGEGTHTHKYLIESGLADKLAAHPSPADSREEGMKIKSSRPAL